MYPMRISNIDPHLTYQELAVIKTGYFGMVSKCLNLRTEEPVFLKQYAIIANRNKRIGTELSILGNKIGHRHDSNVIRVLDIFMYNCHMYVVFEYLLQSLKDFQGERNCQPLPLQSIRPVAHQLIQALQKLKSLDIVHGDLKLDSIMLVDPARLPFMLKLTGFKSAKLITECDITTELQTLCNRAPEIFLGLPYSEAIDMWSLGCVLAELCLGDALFPGTTEQHVIQSIHEIIGPFPSDVLDASEASNKRYAQFPSGIVSQDCQSMPLPPNHDENTPNLEPAKHNLKSLDDLRQINVTQYSDPEECLIEGIDKRVFIQCLKNMLCINPVHRLTVSNAHNERFLTTRPLSNYYEHTNRLKEIRDAMDVCLRSPNKPFDYKDVS